MERYLLKFIAKCPNGTKGILIACSGGVDSTVLFHVLSAFFQKHRSELKLAICHWNFGLRGEESLEDQLHVQKMAKDHSVDCFVFSPDSSDQSMARPPERESTQMWARRLRYASFESFIQDGWVVALAHHQDDLVENMMLRLCRGVNPDGFSGMSEFYRNYWRPFLDYSKKDILDMATRYNLPYREDSSNGTITYKRNFVRHKVLPELEKVHPQAKKHMAVFAKDLRDMMSFAAEHIDLMYAQALKGDSLLLDVFSGHSQGVQKSIFIRFLRDFGCPLQKVTTSLLENVLGLIKKRFEFHRSVYEVHLPDRKTLYMTRQIMSFSKHPSFRPDQSDHGSQGKIYTKEVI